MTNYISSVGQEQGTCPEVSKNIQYLSPFVISIVFHYYGSCGVCFLAQINISI